MAAGKLRHRLVFEQATITRDAMNESVKTWATFATLWGNVQPLRGREFFAAQAANSEVTAKIETRYKAGILATMRIRHGSRIYEIEGMENEGMRNRRLFFMVKEQPQSAT